MVINLRLFMVCYFFRQIFCNFLFHDGSCIVCSLHKESPVPSHYSYSYLVPSVRGHHSYLSHYSYVGTSVPGHNSYVGTPVPGHYSDLGIPVPSHHSYLGNPVPGHYSWVHRYQVTTLTWVPGY